MTSAAPIDPNDPWTHVSASGRVSRLYDVTSRCEVVRSCRDLAKLQKIFAYPGTQPTVRARAIKRIAWLVKRSNKIS